MSVRIATLSLCLIGLASPAACMAEASAPLRLALDTDLARPVLENQRRSMGAQTLGAQTMAAQTMAAQTMHAQAIDARAMDAQAMRAPVAVKTHGIGRQAVQSLLSEPGAPAADDATNDREPAQGASPFRFKRPGNVGRDLGRSYKEMCDRVSRRVWDDPAGKRVRFDVAGKPGLAFEIPLH